MNLKQNSLSAALSLRAPNHSRPHTLAGNIAFPRIVDNQVLSETRNIAQVEVVVTCSASICGAAFRVRSRETRTWALLPITLTCTTSHAMDRPLPQAHTLCLLQQTKVSLTIDRTVL